MAQTSCDARRVNGDAGRISLRNAADAARGAARRVAAHRHQGRLRHRRLRRLQRHRRRAPGVLLPDAGVEAEGKAIQTIEGMAEGEALHPLQRKFLEHAALQCGICTPGILIAARSLLERNPDPTEDEVRYLAGRQPVPLHRLSQDRRRGARCRARNAGRLTMSTTIKYEEKELKIVGTRPLRPDGVRQGDRPRALRRRLQSARAADRARCCAAACACAHPSIDTSTAQALPGVKAVVTRDDFPEQTYEFIGGERARRSISGDMTRNIMAREKVLYDGHAGGGGRRDQRIGRRARRCALIKVDYEVLPHVIDVDRGDAARCAAAVRGHDHAGHRARADQAFQCLQAARVRASATSRRASPRPTRSSSASFKTKPVHQGYIEPQACLARFDADGQAELWTSTQGHFVVRAFTAQAAGDGTSATCACIRPRSAAASAARTVIYIEPVAIALSRKTGHPVKIVMSREDVFKATGPTSGASMTVKIGVQEGRQDQSPPTACSSSRRAPFPARR